MMGYEGATKGTFKHGMKQQVLINLLNTLSNLTMGIYTQYIFWPYSNERSLILTSNLRCFLVISRSFLSHLTVISQSNQMYPLVILQILEIISSGKTAMLQQFKSHLNQNIKENSSFILSLIDEIACMKWIIWNSRERGEKQ